MVSALKQKGIDISLTQLFAYPTIELLARDGAPHANALFKLGVVPLRTRGRELPLFLVNEVTGGMLYGPSLTSHIGIDIPIYGLTSEVPLRTMQGMAARLVRAIRAVQPTGPYRLAGWSFGGTLAYEIAAQLTGDDETVEFLGLIDTHCHEDRKGVLSLQDEDVLRDFASAYSPAIAAELNAIAPGDFGALVRKCQELSILPDRLSVDEVRHYLSRYRTNLQASRDYQAHPIPVPIHLFAAQEGAPDDPWRGWGGVVSEDQIQVVPVPGNHLTMMKDPWIASLGAALSRALQQAGTIERPSTTGGSPRLVPVQNGDRGTPPVICIPGAGGNAASFAGLAAALGEEWAVYGGQPRGLDGVDVPHSTVPAAARAYLAALEESCPDGPVHLLGHSFGGWIAFEMARRLRACGREVASLTLIDSESPGGTRAAWREFTRTEALMKLVELLELAAERPFGIKLEDLAEREAAPQLELLHAHLVLAGLMPRRSSPDALTGTLRTFEAALRIGYEPGSGVSCPGAPGVAAGHPC